MDVPYRQNQSVIADSSHQESIQQLARKIEVLLGQDFQSSNIKQLALAVSEQKIPFTLITHELALLRTKAINVAVINADMVAVERTQNEFNQLEDSFASLYIQHYLKDLETRNHLRIQHINALSEKNLLVHFEAHLLWMQDLVKAVLSNNPELLPESNPLCCEFGQWLYGEGQEIIRDSSHRKHIEELHQKLHGTSAAIAKELHPARNNLRMHALIKRTEFLSLDLGSEISLINNMILVSTYNKDPLTGLLSRRSMDKVLINQMEISKATETSFCVVMCDLDNFKLLNDDKGHLVGDAALKFFAQRMIEQLRRSDLIFRFGGEEFLIVLPSTSYQQAYNRAESLRASLQSAPFCFEGEQQILTASFGVVEIAPEQYRYIDKHAINDVIHEADSRLYKAKATGRNCVV
jgi:diguanylate cyclase (GGDEF)-like protein